MSIVHKKDYPNLTLLLGACHTVSPNDTAAGLKLSDGDTLDGFYPVSKQNASPSLVNSLNAQGFNTDTCTYYAPDIAGWTVK